jgi:PAS domain S-box-containing protein
MLEQQKTAFVVPCLSDCQFIVSFTNERVVMPSPKKKSVKRIKKATRQSSSRQKDTPKKSKGNRDTAREALHQSQARLNLALEAAMMGIWEWDMKNDQVTWSDYAHSIFHMPQKSFDGTFNAYVKLIHPADKDRVLQVINDTIIKKKPYFIQHRIVPLSNTVYWIEAKGKVIANRSGKAIKMMGTVQDVTEVKHKELEIEDWRIRYELLAASSGQVIYEYDFNTGEILWSGSLSEVLGYKTSEIASIDTWIDLIHPEDRELASVELEKCKQDLRKYDVLYRFKVKSGDYLYIHDKGFFLANENGSAGRMIGAMQDITDRIKSEEIIWQNSIFRKGIEATMPGALYVYDVQLDKNIYANGRLPTGYSPEEIESMGSGFMAKIMHPDDLKRIPTWTNEPYGTIKEFEFRLITKKGEQLWFQARNTVFKKENDDRVTQIIAIIQDITEQRKSVEILRESEERFRNLIQDLSIGVVLQGPNAEVLLSNKAARELLDLTEPQLFGTTAIDPAWSVVHEDGTEFPGHLHPVPTAIKTLTPVRGVVMGIYRPAKNDRVWLLVNAEPILDQHGKLNEVICTFTNITERKQIEEALKESELRFRTLQQASYGGIGLHDQGIVLDCNQGLCDITGYSMEELIGINGVELIVPEWRPQVVENIRSGYDKPYDVEGLRKDGSRYFLEIHGKNMPYRGRTIRVTEFRDISERKIAEEKILEQNAKLLTITEDLKRKNEQLEEFTQIVSHNLRSPVGNILTLLNFFESAGSAEEKDEYLTLLKESGTTTLNTLQELTDVLRVKQDKNIKKQDLEFSTVFNHAKAMLNARLTETGADVTTDFSEAPSIRYPSIYLESIFLNLLSNALKYIRTNVKPVIRFKTYYYNKNLILEVSDNGLGIDLERYGHQVFKLRKTFHRHPESRGIGLFMIKNQIEAMGGEITISSKENNGTTFFVNFNKYLQDEQEDTDNSIG